MSLPRFLVPTLPQTGSVELPENEAHHASRVLRCTKDQPIVLFDGLGNEAEALIQSVDKRSVIAAIQSVKFAPRDHMGRLHFAVALPKGDRQRSTVEKLVELGVDSLCPLETQRSVAVVNENNAERIDRYVIEACKQCGRNRLMTIGKNVDIATLASMYPGASIWILHPEQYGIKTLSIHEANQFAIQNAMNEIVFAIGPEGGFTDAEVETAVANGARVLSLGERIQRVETAVSTAAVLGHCWLAPNQDSR